METLIITVKSKEIARQVKEKLENIEGIEIKESAPKKSKSVEKNKKKAKKNDFLADFEQALLEGKLAMHGKLKTKPARSLIKKDGK